jgi:nuclear transport factor 2 (NTF2) superfamily protein
VIAVFSFYQDTSAMKQAHTVSTRRILSQKRKAAKVVEGTTKGTKRKHNEEETIQKRKAAKVVEGTTKDKRKHNEEETIQKRKAAKVVEGTTKGKKKETEERLVVWLFLDIICVYYLILLKTNVFQDFLFNNNTFCLK